MAAFEVLLENDFEIRKKEQLFRDGLPDSSRIAAIRSFGLWLAIEFSDFEACKRVIDACIRNGVLTDWFLFASNCLRVSPPLVITETEIKKAAAIVAEAVL